MITGEIARKVTATTRQIRDTALLELFQSMDHSKKYSEEEWMNFFKTIFYHFWLTDKQYVQHHIADVVSEQLLTDKKYSLCFLEYFWKYMSKEWHNLDMYRLDKYYDLFRRFYMNTFKCLHYHDYDLSVFQNIMQILRKDQCPLSDDSLNTPNGLRYHCIEVILDEFCRACSDKEDLDIFPQILLKEEFLMCLIKPILHLFQNTRDIGLLNRLREEFLQKILNLLDQVDEKALQYAVDIFYSFPSSFTLSEDKRKTLFDIIQTFGHVTPQFIKLDDIPDLVHIDDADMVEVEFDPNMQPASELSLRELEGEKLEKLKEVRQLWIMAPKAHAKPESDMCYPIEALFGVIPKVNLNIPKLNKLNKCSHSKNVHFRLKHNKIKHFHKRQPPSFIGTQ
eukprot:NODE_108_length_18904_cov_0.654826.p6 type:complete len:394 gc:universal NODE_108_length_18904_cov_0.654826:17062-18243(+)